MKNPQPTHNGRQSPTRSSPNSASHLCPSDRLVLVVSSPEPPVPRPHLGPISAPSRPLPTSPPSNSTSTSRIITSGAPVAQPDGQPGGAPLPTSTAAGRRRPSRLRRPARSSRSPHASRTSTQSESGGSSASWRILSTEWSSCTEAGLGASRASWRGGAPTWRRRRRLRPKSRSTARAQRPSRPGCRASWTGSGLNWRTRTGS